MSITRRILIDVREGMRYVWADKVLRQLTLSIALTNLISATAAAEIVPFLSDKLAANQVEIGWTYAAAGVGVMLFALSANRLRQRTRLGVIGLCVMCLQGISLIAFAASRWYGVSVLLWAIYNGSALIIAIYSSSIRQAVAPPYMLGRISSISQVLAWSGIPIGAVVGGFLITATHNISLVYGAIGADIAIVGFTMTAPALRAADKHSYTKNCAQGITGQAGKL